MSTSRFVNGPVISRIDLGEGDWVDIRTRLTFGDRQAIQEKLLALSRTAEGRIEDGQELVHLLEANVEALMRAIVAWGGPGFCVQPEHPHASECEPRPVTAVNIEALDETGERILREVQQRQVTRTKGFTSARTSPSPAAEPPDGSPSASSSSPSSSTPAGPGTS